MPYRLVLAEKPSVARDIAKALGARGGGGPGWLGGGDLRVAWCLGHLVELAEPKAYDPAWKSWRAEHLPMLPPEFRLTPRKDSADQWRAVRDLLQDRDLGDVVNACDAGREGELIFANVYRHAGCQAPVSRLWINAMTPAAIRQGFDRLRPGADLIPLEDAARCRSEADWLVGLNATRAMTIAARSASPSGALLSLGRVQTPTLALMVEREDAIDAFVPEPFWQIQVRFQAEAGTWTASWMRPGKGDKRDRLETREEAEAIVARVRGRGGVVRKVERKTSAERPPLLHDLTALQKDANKRFRWSAKKTLEVAQALYERHKVLTYPRTDSRHLSTAQEPGLEALVGALDFGPYAGAARDVLGRWPVRAGKRVIDDAEVSDHHAIIPTGQDPRRADLSPDDKRLFDLVARRFLAAFHPDAVFAKAHVLTRIEQDGFEADGRTLVEPGWRAIDPPISAGKGDTLLPNVNEGDAAAQKTIQIKDGSTKPPRRFSEATLLGAMERAGDGLDDAELKRAMKRNGLGTPATRAAIIETLINRTFIARDGRDLVPTPSGRALIGVLPVPQLRSAGLTGRWEARLHAVADGAEQRDAFMADIRAFTEAAVRQILGAQLDGEVLRVLAPPVPADGELLGACPSCGGEVRDAGRAWRCAGCALRIPKSIAQRDLSPRMAKALLDGPTKAVQGWTSRAGKKFSAGLQLVNGEVRFHFPESEPVGDCPACGKPVRKRKSVYACDTGRSCPFLIGVEIASRPMTDDEVRLLLAEGRTGRLHGFRQRNGAVFKAALVRTEGGARFDFTKPERAEPDEPPPGGPPFAFGERVHCPLCLERGEPRPGYVVRGRAAWGCSRWKQQCPLRLPFTPLETELPEDQAKRLLGKKRETVRIKLPLGIGGVLRWGRLRIDPSAQGGWVAVREDKGSA